MSIFSHDGPNLRLHRDRQVDIYRSVPRSIPRNLPGTHADHGEGMSVDDELAADARPAARRTRTSSSRRRAPPPGIRSRCDRRLAGASDRQSAVRPSVWKNVPETSSPTTRCDASAVEPTCRAAAARQNTPSNTPCGCEVSAQRIGQLRAVAHASAERLRPVRRAALARARPGPSPASARRTTWSSSVNTAALAPMPSATDITATVAKSGDLRRLRSGELQVAEQRSRGDLQGNVRTCPGATPVPR